MNSLNLFKILFLAMAIQNGIQGVLDECQKMEEINEAQKEIWGGLTLEQAYQASTDVLMDGPKHTIRRMKWKFENGQIGTVSVQRLLGSIEYSKTGLDLFIKTMKKFSGKLNVLKSFAFTGSPNLTQADKAVSNVDYVLYIITEDFFGTFHSVPYEGKPIEIVKTKMNPLERIRLYLKFANLIKEMHNKNMVIANFGPRTIAAMDPDFQTIKLSSLIFADLAGKPYLGPKHLYNPDISFINKDVLHESVDIYAFAMTIGIMEIGVEAVLETKKKIEKTENTYLLSGIRDFIAGKLREIKEFNIETETNDYFRELIASCLAPEPKERPDIELIVARLNAIITSIELHNESLQLDTGIKGDIKPLREDPQAKKAGQKQSSAKSSS